MQKAIISRGLSILISVETGQVVVGGACAFLDSCCSGLPLFKLVLFGAHQAARAFCFGHTMPIRISL